MRFDKSITTSIPVNISLLIYQGRRNSILLFAGFKHEIHLLLRMIPHDTGHFGSYSAVFKIYKTSPNI